MRSARRTHHRDSGREPDDWPEEDLADFAGRVRLALREWEGCLVHLHPEAKRRSRR